MTTYVRKNAFNDGGNFTNADLVWYAKGVEKMMSRALDDPSSWWFFAAIHGEYVDPDTAWYVHPPTFPDWQFINGPPSVSTSPLPDQGKRDLFWNQCQHGSWYFLPWHRGYLLALEAQLRSDIESQGGPSDWALPYWDYFNGDQAALPPAFAEPTLDGKPNPLYVAHRYGLDGKVYVPTPAWEASHPGGEPAPYGPVTDDCLRNDLYTGSNPRTPLPGFGGPLSDFSHAGGPHGNVEGNPHDLVHVYVGGGVSETDYGLMSDPGTAALDPIFYLHHANIDRMWAMWNAAGNSNPTSSDWLNGPLKPFVMPVANSEPWYFSPMQVANLNDLQYSYQELGAVPAGPNLVAARLARLGGPAAPQQLQGGRAKLTVSRQPELLGASTRPIVVEGAGARPVSVALDAGVRRQVARSVALATSGALPDRTYLKLDDVRGPFDAAVLDVHVNLSDPARADERRATFAGQVALFGLRRASVPDGHHGGAGLSFVLDITHLIDDMVTSKTFDVGSLQVSLLPRRALPAGVKVTVGRIGLYREGQ